jgi:hypothetical protein
MATVRAQIVSSAYSTLNAEYPDKVYIGRRLPVDSQEPFGISVEWTQDATDYSAAMMAAIPQHRLTLVITVTAVVVSSSEPIATVLDTYGAEIEENLYTNQTFGGLAAGLEISSIELELDEETQSTAGSLRLEFVVFYYAQEGAPQTAI